MLFKSIFIALFLSIHTESPSESRNLNSPYQDIDRVIISAQTLIDSGQYDDGLKILVELLQTENLSTKNASNFAKVNDMIGNVYLTSGREPYLAQSFFERAKALRSEFTLVNELVESNYNLSKFYLRNNEPQKALEYIDYVLKDPVIQKDTDFNANALYLKGTICNLLYGQNGNNFQIKSARKSLTEASEIYLLTGNSYMFLVTTLELADLNLISKEYEAAVSAINKSLNQFEETNFQTKIRFYSILADSYLGMELYDSAHFYRNLENQSIREYINDSRFQKAAQITEDFRTDKDLDEAEATADLQSRRAKTFGIAAVSLLIILLISYLIFLQTIQRKKLENLQALIRGEEQERQRLASDLHDGIGVLLTSIKMRLSSFEEKVDDQTAYHQSLEQIDQACVEVRRVSHNLSPASLNKLGLEEAILDLFDQVKKNSIEAKAEVQFEEGKIDKDNEILLYRIIQELINNSLKYAQPSKLNLALNIGKDHLNLSYHDQGIGFDKQKIKSGLGLKSIASRVDIMKGKFTYQSILGEGSQFDITIPINA